MTLYSIFQAADLLGIHPRTLRRLIKAGAIGYVDVSERRNMISAGQLQRFIRARTVKPRAARTQRRAQVAQKSAGR